jgi:hypothetical protein
MILAITTARHACITVDLPTAEELITQVILINANDHTSYAHRSFGMARKHAWDLNLLASLQGPYHFHFVANVAN